MFRLCALIVLLTALIAGCASPPPSRYGAMEMLHELQTSHADTSHRDEYLSLRNTLEIAETKLRDGEQEEAEEFFQLSLAKALLLKEKLLAPQPSPAQGSLPRGVASPSPVRQTPPSSPATASPGEKTAEPPPKGDASAPAKAETAASHGPAAAAVSAERTPLPAPSTETAKPDSDRIVGGEGVYVVGNKETLRLIGSRLGVNWRQVARLNGLNPDKPLRPGQKVRYNNRRIVPKTIREGLLINIPERGLYLFKGNRLSASYPVAVGMAKKKEKTIWRTPTGRFRIVDKKENPVWRVPPSIKKEMEEEGEEVLDVVPPGPRNPLGKYAMKTSLDGILIHSTIRPASIYTFSSHGCIRVMPDHMEALFKMVTVNMPGEIIYQPVKMAVTTEGRVFLEVNRDIYEQVKDIKTHVRKLAVQQGVADRIAWERVYEVIKESSGVAEEVTLDQSAATAVKEGAAL